MIRMSGRLGVPAAVVCGLVCCALRAPAAQSVSNKESKMAAEEAAAKLNRPSGAWEVSRTPSNGQNLESSPPVFVWLPVEGVREYILQYSRDPQFQDHSTVTSRQPVTTHTAREMVPWSGLATFEYTVPAATVRVLRNALAAGKWYWRYGYDAGPPLGEVFSSTWEFTIAPDAVAIPFPDVKRLIAQLSKSRPRILITPETLARLRELGRTSMREELEALKRDCDQYPNQEMIPEPEFLPEGEQWAPTYQRVFRITRPFIRAMDDCAEAYLLSGEEKYGLEAKRRLMHLVSWDPNGSTRLAHNDEVGTEIVRAGPRVYDYISPLLTPGEREKCRQCFAVRMPQLYWALRVKPFEVNPFESHAMGYYLEDLTEACIAMAGELDVEEWLEYCLTMLWSPFFPPYGGADGGWCEGPSYWGWSTVVFMRAFRLVEQATGIPIQQREWARKTGYYKLYANPPYNKMSPFGDGQSSRSGGTETMWTLALMFRNPYFKWFADQREYRPSGLDAFVFHDQQETAKAPSDLPQARCFRDVGLVCMHSDLAHGEKDVQVLLRSSPFGSISHAYADQNAFTLDAFGEPLAIASGYYPYYNSPHHRTWTWETAAANSIGVDGKGQQTRDWEAKGRIAHFETNDYCHYALGDAAAAYKGRLRKFDRHIVYLRPRDEQMDPVVVIYDNLASATGSTFQWWLHAQENMEVDAAARTVGIKKNDAGLDVFFLTPTELTFSQTDQFTVPPEGDKDRYPNQWHLTAETTKPSENRRFVTVLLPHRVGQHDPGRRVRLLSGNGYLGAEVIDRGKRHVVAFRTDLPAGEVIDAAGMRESGDVGAESWDADGRPLGRVSITLGESGGARRQAD
jgi:hypothetical protein